MADEELAPEVVPAVGTPSETPPEPETEELDTELDGEHEAEPEDEEFEAEDGQKYRVPKPLVPYLMRNKDYTQKTQATAADRKALEAQQALIEERSKATDEELDARADLRTVNKELQRLESYDFTAWQQHRQTDPMGADEVWNYLQHLKGQKAELDGKLSNAEKSRTDKAQQELAKRVQDTAGWAQTNIPNWKPELTNTLVKFALDSGVPESTLQQNWSPPLYKLLHEAHIGRQLLNKQSAPKPKAAEPPPEPLKVVKARSAPSTKGLSDDLSADEWLKVRNAQLRDQNRDQRGRYK